MNHNPTTTPRKKRKRTTPGNVTPQPKELTPTADSSRVEIVNLGDSDDDEKQPAIKRVAVPPKQSAKSSLPSTSLSIALQASTSHSRVPATFSNTPPSANDPQRIPSTSCNLLASQPSTSSSSSRNAQPPVANAVNDHKFLIPTLLPVVGGKSTRKRSALSRAGRTKAVTKTPEQVKQTANCRKMRIAVIGVIKDVHIEIERRGGPRIDGVHAMLSNLWACWRKCPLMFVSSYKIPKMSNNDEDLSAESEIKDFLPWWLHGLACLVLYPELAAVSADIVSLLQALGQLLAYGNPNLVETCFTELVTVIHSLIEAFPSPTWNDNIKTMSGVTLKYECDENPTDKAISKTTDNEIPEVAPKTRVIKEIVLQYTIRMDNNNDIANNLDGIEHLLDILGVFLPRLFYWSVAPPHQLVSMWGKLWGWLSDRRKFRMLRNFLIPELSYLPRMSTETELSLSHLLTNVITDGIGLQDHHTFDHFVSFCETVSRWSAYWNMFPQSVLFRVHSAVTSIISSDRFDALPSDNSRSCLIKLYDSLTSEHLRYDTGTLLSVQDAHKFQTLAKALASIKTLHPILINAVFQEVKDKFDHLTGRDDEYNKWELQLRDPDVNFFTNIPLGPESSQIWTSLSANFTDLVSVNHEKMNNYARHVRPALRQTCLLIQLAADVHSKLISYVKECNIEMRTAFRPKFTLLTPEMMAKWGQFGSSCVVQLFSSNVSRIMDAEECLNMILDTIKKFDAAEFLEVRLSLEVKCLLATITGTPWLDKFKSRLPERFVPALFLDGMKSSTDAIGRIQSTTLGKCLSVLCSRIFLPFRDFVLDTLVDEMEAVTSVAVTNEILTLISEENWAIRYLGWNFTVTFVHLAQSKFDWTRLHNFRKLLASAILKLPCTLANQSMRSDKTANLNLTPERMRKRTMSMLLSPCPWCSAPFGEYQGNKIIKKGRRVMEAGRMVDDDWVINLIPMPDNDLVTVIMLALPLLKSNFEVTKLTLCSLITIARHHTVGYLSSLIAEFASIAANSNVNVGSEIMTNFGFYFTQTTTGAQDNFSLQYDYNQGETERTLGYDLMIHMLMHHLQLSFEKRCSVTYASKILTILQKVAAFVDRPMILETLRFCLRLTMHRDSNVRNLLAQAVCTELANRCIPPCTAWELMTSLRYELAPSIVEIIVEEFCNFHEQSEELQLERAKAFLNSVSIMGDFRTHAVFIHHYVPVLLGEIVPYLPNDKRYAFVLSSISKFASTSESILLGDGFPIYLRPLILSFKHERVAKFCTFLKEVHNLDPDFLAANSSQNAVNELICFLDDMKDRVIKFIPCLPQKKSDKFILTPTTLSRSDMQNVLAHYFMGFIVFVDTKLHSRKESVTRKRRILSSFTALIEVMGRSRVTTNRTKVYATLNSLFSLGRDYSDLLLKSWKMFACNLDNVAFGQMCVSILCAVSTLSPYLPQEVDNLMTFFISTKQALTAPYFQELYFVTDVCSDPGVLHSLKQVTNYTEGDSWVRLFQLLVRESVHENSHIRLRAIEKLRRILSEEYIQVKNYLLDSEHPVVFKLMTSLLSTSRDADTTTLMRLAESFGSLGAVDPYRFKNSHEEKVWRKLSHITTVEGTAFGAKYLDILVREFQEAEDTTDFDFCACLIQQLLHHFKVTIADSDRIWKTLSTSSRQLVEPLLVAKYKVDKALPQLNLGCPIYMSEGGRTFDAWLANWVCTMSAAVKPGTGVWDLFQFSKHFVSRNNKVGSFLLPFVATYAAIHGNQKQRLDLVTEMETILQKWIEKDKLKINSQNPHPIKDSQAEQETPVAESIVAVDEDVIQYRCTRQVFSVLDHLFLAARQSKRHSGVTRANTQQGKCRRSMPTETPKKVDTANPCFNEGDADSIVRLLRHIPMTTLSLVAFHCEDYKRSLLYIEQELKQSPHKLQDQLNFLQQLHVSLDDMDSVIGVAALREREATMSEVVSECFARGRVEDGVRNLEHLMYEDPTNLIATEGLLQAYLSLDEPRKADTLIKGCISRNPHWEVALQDFQIEATWKLRDWTKLREQIKTTVPKPTQFKVNLSSFHEDKETSHPWAITVVNILSHIQSLELGTAFKLVNEARLKLMNPLVAAANEPNAYSHGYSNIVQLHILTEVEQAIEVLRVSRIRRDDEDFSLDDELKQLINRWADRSDILMKAQAYMDPVLNVRKSILEILRDYSDGKCLDLLNGSIRDCWLTAARVESKTGNFTRALNCIVEAKKYNSPQVVITSAKLWFRKGDAETALKHLTAGISTFFPHVENWTSSYVRGLVIESASSEGSGSETENRKLASQALLLQAQLTETLQLVDMEKNIANYRKSIDVFENSEKNYFTLAGYYDKLLNTTDEKSVDHAITQEHVVNLYAKSLHYGCKYVYQSLPRLLSIWFDFGALGFDERQSGTMKTPTSSEQALRPAGWAKIVLDMQASIKRMMTEVPAYVLLTAFSQLNSRLGHPNPIVWEFLRDLISTILVAHTHQALWMMMVATKSSVDLRKARCEEIYKSSERKKVGLKKMIQDYTMLADRFIEVCGKDVQTGVNQTTMTFVCLKLPRLLASSGFGDVLIPYQVFMSPSIPPNGCGHKSYDAFPEKFVFIQSVEDNIEIMNSVARPKRVTLRGSDGNRYGILCKPNDDLRKDFKVMEVSNVVNWYLHRNPESRQRRLHVRQYAVTALTELHGLLEWVPNLMGFRGSVLSLYRERGTHIIMKDLKLVIKDRDSLEVKRHKFLTKFLAPFPPVFSEWFLNQFRDPQSWYNARLSYVRTAAVMSIVGFVLGLGDRHGENISLDGSNGEIVHVDFNCIFNRGETFQCPERVPFRLTQNMVEAMGPLGVEGVFRRSCEITANLFRQHKDIFMSVLGPFVFDPCVEWGDSGGSVKSYQSCDSKHSRAQALVHLKHIRNRINGSARNFTKEVNTELSVEAQVAYLIDEARSIDNLCQMFVGWTAFV